MACTCESLSVAPVTLVTREAVLAYQWSTDEFIHTPQDLQDFVRQGGILDRPHSYARKRPDGSIRRIN